MTRVLIVEDETAIASFIEKGLRARGYATIVASDGPTAIAIGRDDTFDLVILDLGLPGMPGLEVLRTMRGRGQRIPVIILTARDDLVVEGLDAGADDYVVKPFDVDELLARIRARVRSEATSHGTPTTLNVGDLSLDLLTRHVKVGEADVELTAREYALAEALFRHPGRVLSRPQLLVHGWGYDYDPGSNIVDVYIGLLRKKLGDETIETVRGMGYRLRNGGSRDGKSARGRGRPEDRSDAGKGTAGPAAGVETVEIRRRGSGADRRGWHRRPAARSRASRHGRSGGPAEAPRARPPCR